jgi:hypothetical protein
MPHPYIECHCPALQDAHKDNVKKVAERMNFPVYLGRFPQLLLNGEPLTQLLTGFLRRRMKGRLNPFIDA